MTDAMISYSRRDLPFVKQLHERLDAEGRDIWVDWEDIPKTAEWWDEIKDGIEKADNFVFVISPDSIESEVCGWELQHALELKKRLIPILYQEITEPETRAKMRDELNSHNWIFGRESDDFDKMYSELLKAMDTDLDHVKTHTRLLVRATEWEKNERNKSLLLRGNDLGKAEDWIKSSQEKEPAPDKIQMTYVTESRRISNVDLRIKLTGAIVTLVVSILAVFAVYQAIIAEQQKQAALAAEEDAHALALASSALVNYDSGNQDLAVALAMRATDIELSSETLRAAASVGYAPGTRQFMSVNTAITGAAFSPDDQYVITSSEDGLLRRWDLETGQVVAEFSGHVGEVWGVAYSPDGNLVVSGGEDGILRLWDTASGDMVAELTGHDNAIWDVAYSCNGSHVFSASADGTIIGWNAESGEQDHLYAGHDGPVWTVEAECNTNGNARLLTASEDGTMILWDLETDEILERFEEAHDDIITDVVFSPDGTRIYSVSEDTKVLMRDLTEDGRWVEFGSPGTRHTEGVITVAISPDGAYLLTGSKDNRAILWDTSLGVNTDTLNGHIGTVTTSAFSTDGNHMLTAAQDGTMRLWDVHNGAQLYAYSGIGDNVWSVTFSPNGQYVIANNDMNLIEIGTGEVIRNYASEIPVNNVDFSPDGTLLVGATDDGPVIIWDVETAEELLRYEEHTAITETAIFTPDGQHVISGGGNAELRMWDAATSETVRTFDGHTGSAWTADISTDGTRLASGSSQGEIFLWDIATGDKLREFRDRTGVAELDADLQIWEVAFSPDGRNLATADTQNIVSVWDVASGERIQRLTGHLGLVSTVEFAPDDPVLISGGYDNLVILWDLAGGQELRRFEGHTNVITDVTISPDGKTVVSGSSGGSLRIWHVHTPENLLEWVRENRYVREFTCFEINAYDLNTHGTTLDPQCQQRNEQIAAMFTPSEG